MKVITRLRLRFSRLINVFQSCRSRSTSSSFYSASETQSLPVVMSFPQEMTRACNERRRRKVYRSSTSRRVLKNLKKRKRKYLEPARWTRTITFSDDNSSDDNGDGDESETLFSSSKSFTSDCLSDFKERDVHHLGIKTFRNEKSSRRTRRLKRGRRSWDVLYSPMIRSPMVQRVRPCRMQKGKEGFAVVMKTKDPYGDFKKSMMEMIIENQIFQVKELEQLLHCFLSLNPRCHHTIIIEVYLQIMGALYP